MVTLLLSLVAVLQAATLTVAVLCLRKMDQPPVVAEPGFSEANPDVEVEQTVEPGDRSKLFAPSGEMDRR